MHISEARKKRIQKRAENLRNILNVPTEQSIQDSQMVEIELMNSQLKNAKEIIEWYMSDRPNKLPMSKMEMTIFLNEFLV